MILNFLLRNPSETRVQIFACVAVLALFALTAMRMLAVRAKKRGIWDPQVLFAETYGLDLTDEPLQQKPLPQSFMRTFRLRKLFRGVTIVAFTFTLVFSSTLALRDYIIVSNTDEGDAREAIGDHVGAIVCYKKAMRMDPGSHLQHLNIGRSLFKLGKVAAAIPEFKMASDDENKDPDMAANLGDTYLALDKPADALIAYQRAARIDKTNATYQMAIGRCLTWLGRDDEACAVYDLAIRQNPRSEMAHMQIGELLLKNHHLEEAFAHINRAVTLNPKNVYARNLLASAYAARGMWQEAADEYRVAIAIDHEFAIAQYNLGETLVQMDEPADATQAFRSVMTLTPKDNLDRATIEHARKEIQKLNTGS